MGKELYKEVDRRNSIINNAPGIIKIADNPHANKSHNSNSESFSHGGNYSGGKIAVGTLKEFGKKIEAECLRQNIDINLVKSIMYIEVSHGSGYGKIAEWTNFADSYLPMNIRNSFWSKIDGVTYNLKDVDDNIKVGVTIIKRIHDRLEDPTVEKIATLYNSLAKDKVSDYGARVGEIYRTQPWKKYLKAEVDDLQIPSTKNAALAQSFGLTDDLAKDLAKIMDSESFKQAKAEFSQDLEKLNQQQVATENPRSFLEQLQAESIAQMTKTQGKGMA